MFNLVWKDFLVLKRVLWYAPVYGLISVFAFSNMNGGALSGATVGVTYLLMIQACARDDKNKSEIMLNSLPLRRQDIVLAKYLSVFPYAVLGILSFLLGQGIVSITGIPFPISKVSLEGTIGALVTMLGMISLYYPIYFKLGYLRSNMAGMIIFFACFFSALALLGRGLQSMHNSVVENFIQNFGGWLQAQADWQIASYLLGLALMMMAASFQLSLGFYNKREF